MSASTKIPIPFSLANLGLSSKNETVSSSAVLLAESLPDPSRSALFSELQSTSSIPPLNNVLSKSLTKATTSIGGADWSSRVHTLVLELLRNGDCKPEFEDVMSEVTRRAIGGAIPSEQEKKGQKQKHTPTIVMTEESYGQDGWPNISIPKEVADAGIAFLEGKIRDKVEVVDGEPDLVGERDEY